MDNCIFCKIIKKEIPATLVYDGDNVIGFKDLHPQAREHYLFIHKTHQKSMIESSQCTNVIADVFKAISDFTSKNHLAENGFRVVTNVGRDGGQSVFHTHFHVLGGESLGTFGR